MQLDEFMTLVSRMRELQREFFRTAAADRPPDLIHRAKAAEREVDAAIERHHSKQGSLFDA